MHSENAKIKVYYDGACPKCIRDRQTYEKLAGRASKNVCWIDITDKEKLLREIGIDPQKALTELHVQDEQQQIVSELDAYILLLSKVPLLKPLAWLIGLPLIHPLLAKIYHWQVNRRLHLSGRL
jgi:predicted DCC family thiol-disulfide oxidoreductase YuxK